VAKYGKQACIHLKSYLKKRLALQKGKKPDLFEIEICLKQIK